MRSVKLNQSVAYYTTKELVKKDIKFPEWQRFIDEDRVEFFYKTMKEYLPSYITQTNLVFGRVVSDGKIFLMDGQHRFKAVKKLLDEGIDYPLLVVVQRFKTEQEMYDAFVLINQNYSFDPPKQKSKMDMCKEVVDKLKNKFPKVFSNSVNFKRPNIHANTFLQILNKYVDYNNITCSEELYNRVIEENNRVKKLNWRSFAGINDSRLQIQRHLESCKKKGFYLGMFGKKIPDFWLIQDVKIKRKVFSKIERRKIWDTEFDTETRSEKCPICKDNTIQIDDFHCGHIVSLYEGGTNELSNIRPVCAMCNRGCSVSNMEQFKQTLN